MKKGYNEDEKMTKFGYALKWQQWTFQRSKAL